MLDGPDLNGRRIRGWNLPHLFPRARSGDLSRLYVLGAGTAGRKALSRIGGGHVDESLPPEGKGLEDYQDERGQSVLREMVDQEGEETMPQAQTEQQLETKLLKDLENNDARAYHDHVYKALLNGMSDNDIRKAIRAGQVELKRAWEKENQDIPFPGIYDFADHELDGAQMRASFEELIGEELNETDIDSDDDN